MKNLRFLISRIYLLALLALPLTITTSCSDDDDNTPQSELVIEGVDGGSASIVTQQVLQLKAVTTNVNNPKYSWTIDGKQVSTESTYAFESNEAGSFSINLTVTNDHGTLEKSVTVVVKVPSFYVINEGQKNGSVNQYTDNAWKYDVVAGLGMTSTVGIINNEAMYIVSKNAPFLVKMNLKDNAVISKIDDGLGDNGQGNNFSVVNDKVGVLTTSNGAFKVNLDPLSLGDKLSNMEESNAGDIFCTENYVFIKSNDVIKVYNTKDLSFKKEIASSIKTGFAQTIDGTLWGANENILIAINTTSLESQNISLPDNLNVYYNEWAYTPTGLSASTTENALYFAQKTGEGWSIYGKDIYKYNTTAKNATKFFAAPADKSVYGAGIQVNPKNGTLYLIYKQDGWGENSLNTNIFIADGKTGNQLSIIDYSGQYWFPSTITFY